jgi:tetratricopeptide (TPR) repeat protein
VESNLKKLLKAATLTGAAFFFLGAAQENPTQKAIRDAENLSLSKDRSAATQVLWHAIKKTSDKNDLKTLKDKLIQLSRYFYTDKGFQSYLAGKELFDKQRYSDAMEKFTDSDELESDNVDVLHYVTLTNLWLKKSALAESSAKRALQICTIDIELIRDDLTLEREEASWADAAKTAENLSKDYGDTSAQTEKDWGMALFHSTDTSGAAKKHLESAIQKDPKQPESYYWLAEVITPGAEQRPDAATKTQIVKLLTKYTELCENTTKSPYPREMAYCTHLREAQKRIAP